MGAIFMCNLYHRIKDACAEKGMTVSAMCVRLGMSKSVMSDLNSGRKKTLSGETLGKIAEFLQVSVDSLLGKSQPDVLDEVDIAFYGEFKELDETQKAMVRDMVRLMRRREEQRNDQGV